MAAQTRVEGRLKVTGAARYSADNLVDGLVHGYLITSSIAKGTVASMNTAAAEAAPGVLAVYTPFQPLRLSGGGAGGFGLGHNYLPMQDQRIHHYGQIIGMVVAETFEQARDAAGLITAQYNAQRPATSFGAGVPRAVRPDSVNGEPAEQKFLAPGVASVEALQPGAASVNATYEQPIKFHNAMEPHACVAVWQGNQMTVYNSTQSVVIHAQTVAGALGLQQGQVRVVCPHVGGGFGNKISVWGHPLLAAAAARTLNRPVKVVLTREQTFTATGHRSQVRQTVNLSAQADGTLTTVDQQGWSSTSAIGGIVEAGPQASGRYVYKAQSIRVAQNNVTLDTPAPTSMRAPGPEAGMFALETAMDELAVGLGMDPVELRRKNEATAMPGTNLPWSSKHLAECYTLGAERFGWSRRNATPGAIRDGDWLVGMGMATAVYPAEQLPASVRVQMQADGTAVVATAGLDLGTGLWTVLSVLGSQALGIPVDRITPQLGDSTLPNNFGALGSTTTASVAPAILNAARQAQQALVDLAVSQAGSPLRGLDAASVRYDAGKLVNADGDAVDFAEVLKAAGAKSVEGTSSAGPSQFQQQYAFTSFGAHFCEVRVHRLTGEPRVSRFTCVVDAGAIVNDVTARSQIVGGIIFGIGHALTEACQLEPDTGRIANTNMADYLLPVNADVPPMDVHFLNYPDTRFNAAGVRGIGELGTVGAAAAIGNAVFNATGRRIRELPITVEKLIG